jgi:type I restriction enzyme S subunit
MTISTQWLGDMNSDWEIVNPKLIFQERSLRSYSDDIHLTPSQVYGVLPQTEYMEKNGTGVVQNIVGADSMKHVEVHDFIIHLRSFQGGIEYSPLSGKVSNAYCVLAPKNLIEPKYYRWVLKSSGYIQELNSTTNQLRDGQSIKFEQFTSIGLPMPPIAQQKTIAKFLDEQTKIIDHIIEFTLDLKLKSLESLQSSISHLYKNIADEKIPIRHLVKNVRANYSSLLPTVSLDLVNSKRGTLNTDDLPLTDGSTATFMEAGDVAFGKLRPYLGKVFVAEMRVFAESEFIVMKPNSSKISGAYLRDFLLTNDSLQLLESLSFGAKMPRTSWEQLASLQIPIPTLKRQIEISTEIQKLTEQASQRDLSANKLLTTLSEYKSSLITTSILGQYNSHNGRSVA